MTTQNWIRPQDEKPPDGVVVNTMNSLGKVSRLKRIGRLWYTADGFVYVYYEPMFWQPILDNIPYPGPVNNTSDGKS